MAARWSAPVDSPDLAFRTSAQSGLPTPHSGHVRSWMQSPQLSPTPAARCLRDTVARRPVRCCAGYPAQPGAVAKRAGIFPALFGSPI